MQNKSLGRLILLPASGALILKNDTVPEIWRVCIFA